MSFTAHSFRAYNGEEVRLRLLTPEDGDLLVDLVQRLSSDSRYQRFHISFENVSEEELRRRLPPFLAVDGETSVAVLALVEEEAGERAIGVARMLRQPGAAQAEAAVVVRDDWHRQGVGSTLMRQLVEIARSLGITRFSAMAQAGNHPVHALIKSVGLRHESHIYRGEDYIVIYLEEASQ